MKNVQKELMSISAALSSLTKQVEKIAKAIEKSSGKPTPAKKAKVVRKTSTTTKKKKAAPKKVAPKKTVAKKTVAKKTAAKQKAPTAASAQTMLDSIYGMISRSRNGISVANIKKKTDYEARQVSNALYKLTKKGKIETVSRGVYVKKKK
jgi:hypothetical protein